MKLLKCAIYCAVAGTVGFFFGRLISKCPMRPDKGLFRCYAFEKNGALYEKLNIRKWQAKVPDMSRILPFLMPPKNLSGDYAQRLPVMIRETCVAEITHITVSILGLPCLRIWPGMGGVTVTAIFILLLNAPYILIQRYNRPRLIRLYRKLQAREEKKEGTICVC